MAPWLACSVPRRAPRETIARAFGPTMRAARTPNARQGYRNGAARCPLVGSPDHAIDVARRALLRAPRRTAERTAVPDAAPADPGAASRRTGDGGRPPYGARPRD